LVEAVQRVERILNEADRARLSEIFAPYIKDSAGHYTQGCSVLNPKCPFQPPRRRFRTKNGYKDSVFVAQIASKQGLAVKIC